MKTDRKKFFYTNSAGETFEVSPINPLEEELIRLAIQNEWREAGKPLPELPFYTADTAAGETEKIQIKTRKEAESLDMLAQWEKYEKISAELEAEYSERFLISCFASVEADPDDFPKWKARMKMKRIPIPEDESEKMILFGKTWIIRSTDDITALIVACARTISNVSEEAAQAAEKSFRDSMERTLARVSGA